MKRLLGIFGSMVAALAVFFSCADVPVNDSGQVPFASNASAPASCQPQSGQSSAYFVLAGTAGPVDATIQNGANPAAAADIYDKAGTKETQPFTPTAGTYYRVYPIGGATIVSVQPDSTWGAQIATVDIRCTSTTEGFAPGAGGGGGGGNVQCSPSPCNVLAVNSPLPSMSPTAGPLPSPIPAWLPVVSFGVFWNGTAWVPISSTAPLPVTTPPNVQPSPLYTMPVTTPAPGPTVSPNPNPARANTKTGTGAAVYLDTWGDTMSHSTTISTATTTLVKAGVANQNMYVFGAWAYTTGTSNAGSTLSLVYGQTTTTPCDTGQSPLTPVIAPQAASTGSGVFGLWSGSANDVANSVAFTPASVPLIVPAASPANNVCVISTVSTTLAVQVWVWTAIHAN